MPEHVGVVIHGSNTALALAQPYIPIVRQLTAPAARRYLVGWFGRDTVHVLAPRILRDRASNVPGSEEMALRAPAALYAQLVVGPQQPPAPSPVPARPVHPLPALGVAAQRRRAVVQRPDGVRAPRDRAAPARGPRAELPAEPARLDPARRHGLRPDRPRGGRGGGGQDRLPAAAGRPETRARLRVQGTPAGPHRGHLARASLTHRGSGLAPRRDSRRTVQRRADVARGRRSRPARARTSRAELVSRSEQREHVVLAVRALPDRSRRCMRGARARRACASKSSSSSRATFRSPSFRRRRAPRCGGTPARRGSRPAASGARPRSRGRRRRARRSTAPPSRPCSSPTVTVACRRRARRPSRWIRARGPRPATPEPRGPRNHDGPGGGPGSPWSSSTKSRWHGASLSTLYR